MTIVLVTGSTGHVGAELARRVADGGLVVRALVRTDAQVAEAEKLGWAPVEGDLTQPSSLSAAVDSADLVLHSAATGSEDWTVAEAVNVEGTRALVNQALQAGVKRFVHISTVSVYGSEAPDELDEESPLAVDDKHPYMATKSRAEVAVGEAKAAGLETVILRPGAVCNVVRSQWGNELVDRLRAKGWPADLHPDDIIPWVHTSNLAEMAWLCLTHPAAANETFIAVDRDVTVNEFFVPIANALGQPVVVPDRAPATSRCRLGKIAAVLGYEPSQTFEQTMEGLVALATGGAAPG
jgi:nucleoside-diphosphate-sugar epimerase